jgi:hypothetical protein
MECFPELEGLHSRSSVCSVFQVTACFNRLPSKGFKADPFTLSNNLSTNNKKFAVPIASCGRTVFKQPPHCGLNSMRQN